MTTVYWAAAAVALVSAFEAGVELTRDRTAVLAAWMLSMLAMSASLCVAAVVPVVMGNGPGLAASGCAALGIIGTWAFAEVMATRPGDTRRVAGLLTVPLAAGAGALLLLLGLHWAGSRGADGAGLSPVTTIMAALTVMAYYVPGLCRIAVLAHQRAESIPGRWTRMTMRMACACACAELALLVARSAIVVAGALGARAGQPAISLIAVLQGAAMICGLGGLATAPVMMAISRRWDAWFGVQS
jgi:hypothetical protein